MARHCVYGYWLESGERYANLVDTDGPYAAELYVRAMVARVRQELRICAVVSGDHPVADLYTQYVDPDDPRNIEALGLRPGTRYPTAVVWTVFGIVTAPTRGWRNRRWNRRTGGQRRCDHVRARSAREAEGAARSRAADEGGVLTVCAVLEGRFARADSYARFENPRIAARAGGPR